MSIELRCRPHVHILLDEAKAWRHHADDLVREIVELDGAADGTLVATELFLPGAVAEDGDAWSIRTVVVFGDGAPKEWCDAKQGKELRGHPLRVHASRLAGASHREHPRAPGGKASNRAALVLPIEPVCGRDVGARIGTERLGDHHELVAVRVRQRPQQELIDDGEDGGVAADAKGQRQNDGQREARTAPEATNGVLDVSPDIFHDAHRPLVVAALLESRQIAEPPPGGALRIGVAQPVTSVVACERIDMERHLALHVAIPRARLEQCEYATKEARWSHSHVRLPARARSALA